jgi:hypothetical protein
MQPLDGEVDRRGYMGLSSDDTQGPDGGHGRDQGGVVNTDEAVMPGHDTLLQGGPLDQTTIPVGEAAQLDLEVDGVVHRYTRTDMRGGPGDALAVYTYAGPVDADIER